MMPWSLLLLNLTAVSVYSWFVLLPVHPFFATLLVFVEGSCKTQLYTLPQVNLIPLTTCSSINPRSHFRHTNFLKMTFKHTHTFRHALFLFWHLDTPTFCPYIKTRPPFPPLPDSLFSVPHSDSSMHDQCLWRKVEEFLLTVYVCKEDSYSPWKKVVHPLIVL